jgi:hypothetical protein
MLDLNRPITTRNGYPVRIVETGLNSERPILAIIKPPLGREVSRQYRDDGTYFQYRTSQYDLINPPISIGYYYAIDLRRKEFSTAKFNTLWQAKENAKSYGYVFDSIIYEKRVDGVIVETKIYPTCLEL